MPMTTPRKGALRGEIAPNQMTVDEAVADTVHRTPGCHPKSIANDIGRSYRYVLDIADEMRDAELKVSEIGPLVLSTGNPLVLDVIEHQVGRVAYRLPAVTATCRDALRQCASVLRETSDVATALADVAEDGLITEREVARIEHEAEQAIVAILEALATVNAGCVRQTA
jgi:hypothetical protein